MIKKILSFGVVGILATIIDFMILFILKSGLNLNVYLSTAIAFVIALLFNYIASMKYVFVAKKGLTIFKQSVIFIATALIGLLINQLIMYISVEFIQLYYMLAKIFATVIVMIFNFISRHILLEES